MASNRSASFAPIRRTTTPATARGNTSSPRATYAAGLPAALSSQLENPGVALWITEGQRKADALASAGRHRLALLGVWNLKGKNAFGGVTVLADFDYVAWKDGTGKGRDVLVVYDSDLRTKPRSGRPSNGSPNT